jgi:choline-sulfatase
MFTGRFPHETGIQTNTNEKIDPSRFPCMGTIFKEAGYETGFFGKWHLPYDAARSDQHGFDVNVAQPALYSGAPIAEFIRRERRNPFLAVASFVNPHNICEWPRGQELPGGPIGEPPGPDQCPPLKSNSQPPANEPDIMAHMRRAYQAHRLFPVGHFSDEKWRQLIWAYYRLVEKVDRQVGEVLAALRESGQEENTWTVFLSDHGECQGAHRWNQKTVFFDESARVPFVIARKGVTRAGLSDVLVHTGADLIPTLCQFAGREKPKGLPGRGLVRAALGRPGLAEPPCIVISNHMVQCEPVDGLLLQPHGRMVRSHRYKYCLYSLGKRREFLVDMVNDPGEMRNLAQSEDFTSVLREHRDYLARFAEEHKDEMARTMLAGLDS